MSDATTARAQLSKNTKNLLCMSGNFRSGSVLRNILTVCKGESCKDDHLPLLEASLLVSSHRLAVILE